MSDILPMLMIFTAKANLYKIWLLCDICNYSNVTVKIISLYNVNFINLVTI